MISRQDDRINIGESMSYMAEVLHGDLRLPNGDICFKTPQSLGLIATSIVFNSLDFLCSERSIVAELACPINSPEIMKQVDICISQRGVYQVTSESVRDAKLIKEIVNVINIDLYKHLLRLHNLDLNKALAKFRIANDCASISFSAEDINIIIKSISYLTSEVNLIWDSEKKVMDFGYSDLYKSILHVMFPVNFVHTIVLDPLYHIPKFYYILLMIYFNHKNKIYMRSLQANPALKAVDSVISNTDFANLIIQSNWDAEIKYAEYLRKLFECNEGYLPRECVKQVLLRHQ